MECGDGTTTATVADMISIRSVTQITEIYFKAK